MTDQLAAVRRHCLVIAVTAAIGLMLAEGFLLTSTEKYSAKSVVYFHLQSGTSGADLQAGSTYVQSQTASYAELATSPAVLQAVIQQYALTESPAALAGELKVSVVQGTAMISVVATDPSPAKAAVLANAVSQSLDKQVNALTPRNLADRASVEGASITKATAPTVPSSPRTKRVLGLGLVGGLIVGAVVAVLRDLTESRILKAQDVQELTDTPILGQFARRSGVPEPALIGDPDSLARSDSPGIEEIRRVRTNLRFLDVEERPLVVAVTSAVAAEGKSMIAGSLARAFGEAGQSVLLMDADLRFPDVGRMADLDDTIGLSSVLCGAVRFADAVQRWGTTRVDVLTAGESPTRPSKLLASLGMEQLIEAARANYDVVVIDTAALAQAADTAILARVVSGYVLVARAGVVHADEFFSALATLEYVGGRVFGIVMNDITTDRSVRTLRYGRRRRG